MAARLFPDRGLRLERPAPVRLLAPEAKAVPTLGPGVASLLNPMSFWLPNSPGGDFTDPLPEAGRGLAAYRLSSLVYACMRFRAVKLSEPPLWVYEEADDGESPLEGDHPLAEVLEQPNPDQEMAELLEVTSLYLDAFPSCLWVKSRDRAGRVGALYAFAHDDYVVEPADGRLYGRFRVQTATGEQTYTPDDVVYFRHVGGVAPLEAALGHVAIGEQMRQAVRAQLRNAIRPGSVTSVKGELSDASFERLKGQLTAFYAGTANRGRNIVFDQEASWELVRAQLDELAMGPVQGDVEAAVCQAFAIHPALVGAKIALENSSGLSDTLKPALAQFYDQCAFPAWARYEKVLTRSLLREADPDPLHFVRFVKDDVRALAPDMGEKADTAMKLKGLWTVNERRAFTDKDPEDDPAADEVPELQPPPPPVVAPGAPAPPPPAAGAAAKAETKAHQIPRAEVLAAVHDAVTRAHEPYLELVAAERLAADQARIAALVENVGGTKDDPGLAAGERPLTAAQRAALEAAVAAYLVEEAGPAWTLAMTPPLAHASRQAVERAAASLGVRFDVLEPGIRAFVDREVGFLVTSVTETTRDAVRAAIGDALEAGEGIGAMATRVREAGAFSRDRATLIARTESTRATNGAQAAAMQDYSATTGLPVEAEWYTALDDRVRPEHAAQHGVRRPVGEPFPNGRTHPDEPNCRCTILYHIAPGQEAAA